MLCFRDSERPPTCSPPPLSSSDKPSPYAFCGSLPTASASLKTISRLHQGAPYPPPPHPSSSFSRRYQSDGALLRVSLRDAYHPPSIQAAPRSVQPLNYSSPGPAPNVYPIQHPHQGSYRGSHLISCCSCHSGSPVMRESCHYPCRSQIPNSLEHVEWRGRSAVYVVSHPSSFAWPGAAALPRPLHPPYTTIGDGSGSYSAW